MQLIVLLPKRLLENEFKLFLSVRHRGEGGRLFGRFFIVPRVFEIGVTQQNQFYRILCLSILLVPSFLTPPPGHIQTFVCSHANNTCLAKIIGN